MSAPAPGLAVTLERPLPATLPVRTGTAVFLLGSCFHPEQAVRDVEILVDGLRHRPTAFSMPRPDVFAQHPSERSYRSGFWATVPVPARERTGTIELALSARLAWGQQLTAPLGAIAIVDAPPPPEPGARPAREGAGLIAICMATFEPDPRLFTAQVMSLREQSDAGWICLISDDCSGPEHVQRIHQVIGEDARFAFSRSKKRLGFYRNFERALSMVPARAELVGLCDQDDRWHPDKLATLRAALDGAPVAYSDLRLVDADHRVLRDTFWRGRRNNHSDLASMLVANTITGAAMLMRREVAELALPFPDMPGFQFHDHWLGVLALATGAVAYVDRPLYDYVQHAGAVFGDVSTGSTAPVGRRWRPRRPHRGWPGELVTAWRASYFYGFASRDVQAQAVLARCGPRLQASKRRVLERYVASERSPAAFAWLAARSLRTLMGHTETLGTEIELAQGIVWRWAAAAAVAGRQRPGRHAVDAGFPPPASFNQRRLRRWRAQV